MNNKNISYYNGFKISEKKTLAHPMLSRGQNYCVDPITILLYRKCFLKATTSQNFLKPTAPSWLWLVGCNEEFLTFQMESMWPDSVGWFTFCQTWVCKAQKTGSLPENVKLLWQLFAGTVLFGRILAEADTCLAVDRNYDLHTNAGTNKQHLFGS